MLQWWYQNITVLWNIKWYCNLYTNGIYIVYAKVLLRIPWWYIFKDTMELPKYFFLISWYVSQMTVKQYIYIFFLNLAMLFLDVLLESFKYHGIRTTVPQYVSKYHSITIWYHKHAHTKSIAALCPPPTEYHLNTMVHEAKHQHITVLKVQ